ncbi:MAG: Kelch repeat-containing protein [Nitrososphaerales archaeon]
MVLHKPILVGAILAFLLLLGWIAPVTSAEQLGAWNPSTSYPIAAQLPSCVVYSGFVYCVGGINSSDAGVNSVFYAPLSSTGVGSWTQTTSYPTVISGESCVANSGYIYCVGSGLDSDLTYFASLSSSGVGTWQSTTNYPFQEGGADCITDSGFIYCIGGTSNPSSTTQPTYYAEQRFIVALVCSEL